MSASKDKTKTPLVPREILFPFILITSCFAWWGIANNMTDTLLAFFKRLMSMSDFQTSWIQLAFYGAYFCLAIPAALIVQRFSYKVGVLIGLGTFALGGILFYPASITMQYGHFLFALYVLAGGCSILETSANPYILAMGPEETATRRLNLAQSFNPIGSLTGVALSNIFILSNLTPLDASDRAILDAISPSALTSIQVEELQGAMGTYVGVSILLIIVWFAILFCKMPTCSATVLDKGVAKNIWNFVAIPFDAFHFSKGSFFAQMGDILRRRTYLWGVIAQFFYVGAQIGVWSYTIRYCMKELHILEADASLYYIYALVLFVGMRFVCTYLMKFISPNMLLFVMSLLAVLCCLPVMFVGGGLGVISLLCISGCMSLMFPTIYGIASQGLGEKMKIGGCGLIMAILGGAVLTAIQGFVSDATNINYSYIVPLICFIIVGYYGLMTEKKDVNTEANNFAAKTPMPNIPGKMIAGLAVCLIAVVAICVIKPSISLSGHGKAVNTPHYYVTTADDANNQKVIEIVPILKDVQNGFEGSFAAVIRYYTMSKDASSKVQYHHLGIVRFEEKQYKESGTLTLVWEDDAETENTTLTMAGFTGKWLEDLANVKISYNGDEFTHTEGLAIDHLLVTDGI